MVLCRGKAGKDSVWHTKLYQPGGVAALMSSLYRPATLIIVASKDFSSICAKIDWSQWSASTSPQCPICRTIRAWWRRCGDANPGLKRTMSDSSAASSSSVGIAKLPCGHYFCLDCIMVNLAHAGLSCELPTEHIVRNQMDKPKRQCVCYYQQQRSEKSGLQRVKEWLYKAGFTWFWHYVNKYVFSGVSSLCLGIWKKTLHELCSPRVKVCIYNNYRNSRIYYHNRCYYLFYISPFYIK